MPQIRANTHQVNFSTSVSVIIPVYNASMDINACVESLLLQTLKHIEIIFVDDGSTDDSLIILEEYRSSHANIKVIKLEENIGRMQARKAGLDIATGEYIGFVDADDKVKDDMFTLMYAHAIRNNADIVSCGIRNVSSEGKTIKEDLFPDVFDEVRKERIMGGNPPCLWNSIYRASLFKNEGLVFSKLSRGEDLMIVPCLFYYAKKTVMLNEALYFYKHTDVTHLLKDASSLEAYRRYPSNLLKDLIGINDLIKAGNYLANFFLEKETLGVDLIPLTTKFPEFFNRYNLKYVEHFFNLNDLWKWYFTNVLTLMITFKKFYLNMDMNKHMKKEDIVVIDVFEQVFYIRERLSNIHTPDATQRLIEDICQNDSKLQLNIRMFLRTLRKKQFLILIKQIFRKVYGNAKKFTTVGFFE